MKSKILYQYLPVFIGIGYLLSVCLIHLYRILSLNSGMFVYTIDDPYIHLALAENIVNGHYGINSGEVSAPSSSIMWPFILAIFGAHVYSPLYLNIFFATASVYVLTVFLNRVIQLNSFRLKSLFVSILVILLILSTNAVGLIFIGMEHSFQVLMVLLIAHGLIIEIETKEVKSWLIAAITIAPLIRYECLAISIPAILFLFSRGHYKQVLISSVLITTLLGSFSVFLMSLELGSFPSSVEAKSNIVQGGGLFSSVLWNFLFSMHYRPGIVLGGTALFLLHYYFYGRDIDKKKLSVISILAIMLQYAAGSYGGYNRYEIYILAFIILIAIYIYASQIVSLINNARDKFATFFKVLIFTTGAAFIMSPVYIYDQFTLAFASNNIYQQQYQMHRFATEFYNKPIAVNDLGYVSFNNDNYVLDLWGLGSHEALKLRLTRDNPEWMHNLCNTKNVELVMIYDWWFPERPNEWIEIGILNLGIRAITPSDDKVHFFATNEEAYYEIVEKLSRFIETLPEGATFSFNEM